MLAQKQNYEQIIEDLRKSLAWMDLVLSSLAEGVLIVDLKGKIFFANDAIATILGNERIFLLGLHIWDVLPVRFATKHKRKSFFSTALQTNDVQSLTGMYDIRRKKERLLITVKVGFIEKINQAIFVITDITEQKKSEEEHIKLLQQQIAQKKIEESQKLLQTIIDSSPAVIYMKDLQGKYLMVNTQYEKLFHVARNDIQGKTDYAIFPKDIAHAFRVNDHEVFGTKQTIHREEIAPHEDGMHTYISVKFPLFDENNQVYAVCGISTDITERKELEKRKDDFINMASHELKTPVTSMKIFHGIIEKFLMKGEIEKSLLYSSKIDRQLKRLDKLIKELLTLSRIQAGKFDLEKVEFDFNQLILEVAESVQATTERHTIIIEGSVNKSFFGDRDRLGQVLINFLSNAVKYSPEKGNIILRVNQERHYLSVQVRDFGIGIPKKYQDKIFERFYQVPRDREKTFPGLGIGLFIASEIIRKHRGKITVKSAEGKGTIMSFVLPI